MFVLTRDFFPQYEEGDTVLLNHSRPAPAPNTESNTGTASRPKATGINVSDVVLILLGNDARYAEFTLFW